MSGLSPHPGDRELPPLAVSEQHAAQQVVLVDVREASEWANGHIEGAVHIPLGTLPARLGDLPDDRPVVFYCRSGVRSAQALDAAERIAGRADLNLKGGILAWQAAGLPIIR